MPLLRKACSIVLAIAFAATFFSARAGAELAVRESFAGQPPFQMYVQHWRDDARSIGRGALILIHGGAHTGVGFTTTPDGEPGWALQFAKRGWDVYVVDWPGMGRSGVTPANADESIMDVIDTLTAYVEKIGPVVLVGHSIGGAVAFKVAERKPSSIRAVVALAPAAVEIANTAVPMAPTGKPIVVSREDAIRRFANAAQFPKDQESLDNYLNSLVAMSPKIRNAAVGLTDELKIDRAKLDTWQKVPALFLIAEEDRTVPRASSEETAKILNIKLVALGVDWNFPGHGHMFPLEKDQSKIADRVDQWLSSVLGPNK